MYYRFIAIALLLLFFSCERKKNEPMTVETKNYEVNIPLSHGLANSLEFIKIHSKVLPVLRDKEDNLVLSWEFEVKNTNMPIYLKGLAFSLKGTESLDDFTDFFIESENLEDSSSQFGKIQQVNADSTLVFADKRKLTKGTNSFRLKCRLSKTANILNHLRVKPLSMKISGKKYSVEAAPVQRKLGIALLQHGQNNIHTYRIPGLVTTEKGTLIAVYDMRHDNSKDLQGNIDVGMSRSTDGGQTWQDTDVIIDMGEYGRKPEKLNGVGDPSILYDKKTNTLWVAALWAHGMSEKKMIWRESGKGLALNQTGQLVLVKSTNDGKTWSEPYNITSQVKNPDWQLVMQGPGRGITVGDSVLVFPAQFKEKLTEQALDGGDYTPFSTIMYSKDNGKTWKIGTGAKANTTEAQVIVHNDSTLMLNMRDDRNRSEEVNTNGRAVAVTSDFGATWSSHATTNKALVEPNCMASFIKEEFRVKGEKQTLVLFSNPASKTHRNNITVKVSLDNAESWDEEQFTLIDAGKGQGYSCLTKVDDEHVGILYEGSGADLVFQVFHINELIRN